jgi:cytochrome c biogenesis protein CcdA
MLRLAFVAISVGIADSVNPSTAGPALFLATTRKGLVRVAQFTLGVFSVNLIAGLVLTIGPGRLLLALVPHPSRTVKHAIELVAGVALVGAAFALWVGRHRLARRELPGRRASGGSATLTGASVSALELPTAAPYLAVIAGIVGADVSVPAQAALVTLYNVAFVLPLLAIIAVLAFAGDHATRWLEAGAAWMQRRWPVLLATILLLIGAGLTIAGGVGLVRG